MSNEYAYSNKSQLKFESLLININVFQGTKITITADSLQWKENDIIKETGLLLAYVSVLFTVTQVISWLRYWPDIGHFPFSMWYYY